MRLVVVLLAVSLCGPNIGCNTAKADEFPALSAKCRTRHLKYQIWCYGGGDCYGTIWPNNETFLNNTFAATVGGESREDVVKNLMRRADDPLPVSPHGKFKEVYSVEGP